MERIILGIDPGTTVMGYGFISIKGNKITLIATGVIQLHKIKDHALKLKKIFDRTSELIDHHNPDELAIEAQFFGKNVQSMLKLGRAQGVAIAAALSRDVPYTEYAPKSIKQSVTGKGSASKEQVAGMIKHLLNLKKLPEQMDATDALATAVCHYLQSKHPTKLSGSKKTSWATYVNQNKDKVKK